MPPQRADHTVRIVDDVGEADMTVAVIGDQVVDLTGASDGDVLTVQADGTVAPEAPAAGGGTPASVPYSPAWTASGVNPTLGNGLLSGEYAEDGEWIDFRISLTIGTTTNPGSGIYAFSLPVPAKALDVNFPVQGWAYMEDAGVAAYAGFPRFITVNTVGIIVHSATVIGAYPGQVSHNIPFSFDDNDYVRIAGRYERAA